MNESNEKQSSNREVKSSVFTTYFSEPENAAQLYSALRGSPASPEDIEYTTLEGVLFLARKNDLAFTVKNRVLVISEHQSTVNNNMPLRDIIYYGRTMERVLKAVDIYRSKVISIPTPEFFVFYNGSQSYPPEKILKLSDSYIEKTNTPMLELLVKVININLPAGHSILERCKPLYEYSWFIQKVKEYTQKGLGRDTAITFAIQECIKTGIFANFVQKYGSEAVNMLFTQFNLEDAKKIWYEEAFEDGEERGLITGRSQGGNIKLIDMVCQKLRKRKTLKTIAEELEEPLENVERICAAVEKCGLEANAIEIYEQMQNETLQS